MNSTARYIQVQVGSIELADHRYALDPFLSEALDEQLITSINRFGILHPPLLLEAEEEDRFIVLSGRKRIRIAAQRATPQITALLLRRAVADQPQTLLPILLQHALIGSHLSTIEQAIFLNKALAVLPAEDIHPLLPMMGYRNQPHLIRELIALLDLDPVAQLALHETILSPRSGKKLLQFPPVEQRVLTELVRDLQLGSSKQNKVIDQIFALKKRLQIDVETLLGGWRQEEKEKQFNGPQKASSLLQWLQRRYLPRLVAEEERFKRFCQQLALPTTARLSHTPSFEDERLTLSLEFNSRRQLENQWPRIRAILEDQNS